MTLLSKHLFPASAAVVAAATSVLVAAAPAEAKSKDVTVYAHETEALQRRVSYADLNLAATSDQNVLQRRVTKAVRFVCEPHSGRGQATDYARCTDFAWNGARPQMAMAFERARQLAATGSTNIAAVAITISGGAQ